MVAEVRPQYDSEYAAISAVAVKLGIHTAETLRKWVRRTPGDVAPRGAITAPSPGQAAELKRLRAENAELRRANEILKAASAFFAAELDRPQQNS
jgi:transposase